MNRPASLVAGIFLAFISLAQLCRFVFGVRIIVGNMEIPVWLSALAFGGTAALALWLLSERASAKSQGK